MSFTNFEDRFSSEVVYTTMTLVVSSQVWLQFVCSIAVTMSFDRNFVASVSSGNVYPEEVNNKKLMFENGCFKLEGSQTHTPSLFLCVISQYLNYIRVSNIALDNVFQYWKLNNSLNIVKFKCERTDNLITIVFFCVVMPILTKYSFCNRYNIGIFEADTLTTLH